MRKLLVGGLTAALALAVPGTANAGVFLTQGATAGIPASNDFGGQLAALGLTQYTTTGASLFVDADTTIAFEFLGSESRFNDTFTALGAAPLSLGETTNFTNNFASPVPIGSSVFAAGSLAGRLTFSSTNPNGATATVGQDGFGIFLDPNQPDGLVSIFYLGYDDQVVGQDDDYDDFIVRAIVATPRQVGAVPETAIWAMMLFGFAGVGVAMRRRKGEAASQRIRLEKA